MKPATRERFARMMPRSLSAQITTAMAIAAVIVFAVIATMVTALLAAQSRELARADSDSRLSEIETNARLQAEELDSFVIAFTEWTDFYLQTHAPDPAFISAEFDPWLSERAEAPTVLWVAGDGEVVHSQGDPDDIARLTELAKRGVVSGPVRLPSGPAIIAIRPIVGDPPATPYGFLAIARPMAAGGLDLSTSAGVHVIVGSVDTVLADDDNRWKRHAPPPGYRESEWMVADAEIRMRGVLVGIDGADAAGFEIRRPDPWLGEGNLWKIILVTSLLGIATVLVGLLMGVLVGGHIGRPLVLFAEYLRGQGYQALHGLRTDEELRINAGLPTEFKEFGTVLNELLVELRVNQADLIEAGDQAAAAERAFRTVVEESPEVKILVRDGVVEIANPAAAHFFGLHLGDLVRAEPEGLFAGIELYDEAGRPLDVSALAGRVTGEPIVARCVTPGQPDRWIEMSVATIGRAGMDYVISARNITEERRLEALREEILSLVSHDLRSPLTVVRGYLDILERPLDDDRRAAAVTAARRSTQRMEALLDDLLYATRAERAFAPTVMRAVSLSEVAAGVASSLQLGAEQEIVVEGDGDVSVLGDATRLEQAVTNLVGNAIKHGPAEGQVRITVSADEYARLTVEDDGPGVPAADRERVFERGVRGETIATKPGLGLGLYIVRVIAEAHGGTAFIEDSPSGGSRFVLQLPLKAPDS